MVMFFVISLIGLLWNDSYKSVIQSVDWFKFYSLFIGSWVAFLVAQEYHAKNTLYFKSIPSIWH